jgi:L-ascorbate metabolism protein UlaG (beta-lactamase superfamily)/rhodanese-related sulfurtransferase
MKFPGNLVWLMKNSLLALFAVIGIATACTAQDSVKTVDVDEFSQLMLEDSTAQLLDVRTKEEYMAGYIEGAINIDYLQEEKFKEEIKKLDRRKTYYVYCRSGRRSHNAAVLMQELGLRVVNLKGGFLAWKEREMPYDIFPSWYKDLASEEIFTTPKGDEVTLWLIKHGSLAINYKCYEIQIDPVAMGKPFNYAAMPKADLILVTHEHPDHLDLATINQLTKDSTILYLNERSQKKIGKGQVLHNGDTRQLGHGIKLTAVPAYNTTNEHLQYHPKGVGNGYVLDFDGFKVYVAGDTEDVKEMAQLKGIDVALLPVNQPFTMTVGQAVHAARMIHPKVLIPYHFNKTDVTSIKDQLKGSGIEVRLRDMQ